MVGCVDLGPQNSSNKLAKHALVFLIQGLHFKFKQTIAYYFRENSIPSIKLKEIIAMLIEELVASICDHKLAKFEHIKQCFDIDKTRAFQMMRGLREIYFKLGGFNPLNMKVSVVAKTLSYTVAAAIESMCSSSDLLPAEAIITAEF
jgi:hypothetical protein